MNVYDLVCVCLYLSFSVVPRFISFFSKSFAADARDAFFSTPAEAAVAAAVGRKVFVALM